MVCLMSEEEQRIVDRYLEKYKITNKSRWLRETILMFIHKNMEEDYPTLFGEHDMRRWKLKIKGLRSAKRSFIFNGWRLIFND